jgi:hypothetical protein
MHYEWLTPEGFAVRVVIANAQLRCVGCDEWKPAREYGLRCLRGNIVLPRAHAVAAGHRALLLAAQRVLDLPRHFDPAARPAWIALERAALASALSFDCALAEAIPAPRPALEIRNHMQCGKCRAAGSETK